MASNDNTLQSEVRVFTSHSVATLTADDMDTVFKRAKRHIRSRLNLEPTYDFYQNDKREEALFWFACLFSKVSVGQLDAQTVQVSAVDAETLLAKDDDEVTTWYRNAERALNSIKPDGEDNVRGMGITSPTRDGRVYGEDGDSSDAFDI